MQSCLKKKKRKKNEHEKRMKSMRYRMSRVSNFLDPNISGTSWFGITGKPLSTTNYLIIGSDSRSGAIASEYVIHFAILWKYNFSVCIKFSHKFTLNYLSITNYLPLSTEFVSFVDLWITQRNYLLSFDLMKKKRKQKKIYNFDQIHMIYIE